MTSRNAGTPSSQAMKNFPMVCLLKNKTSYLSEMRWLLSGSSSVTEVEQLLPARCEALPQIG